MLSASLAGCVDGSSVVSSQAPSQQVSGQSVAAGVSQAQLDAYFAKVERLRSRGLRRLRAAKAAAAAVPIDWTTADQRWTALGYIYGRMATTELTVAGGLRAIVPPAPLAEAHALYANGWRLLGWADASTETVLRAHRVHFDWRRIDRRGGYAVNRLRAYHRMVISYAKGHGLRLPGWLYQRWTGPLSQL
jgi:hypothetical protein